MDFLSENFRLVSLEDVFDSALQNRQDRFCALTFDDGLKDHYTHVWPILKSRCITGTFFIITSAFEHNLPSVHGIHVLLSRFSGGDLIDFFNDYLKRYHPHLLAGQAVPLNRRLTARRLHEDIPTANFKEAMIILPDDIRSQFLSHCFKQCGLDSKKINQDLFMPPEEVKVLKHSGMTIGSHTHGHYALDTLSPQAFRRDVALAQGVFSEVLGAWPRLFSYPHGRSTPTGMEILKDNGFEYALTIERRGVKAGDNPFLLPRYDAGDIGDFLNRPQLL